MLLVGAAENGVAAMYNGEAARSPMKGDGGQGRKGEETMVPAYGERQAVNVTL